MRKIIKETIIETKEEREALIERVDVLQKVKDLLLLPNMEMATTKHVAAFYEVPHEAISTIIRRNIEELESDGMYLARYSEIKEVINGHYDHLLSLGVSKRGTNVFPKRAILRVGMLLRDSEVAKEVRSQLLNIEEKAQDVAPVIVTADIDHETKLHAAIGKALSEGDMFTYGQAIKELEAWKNRHIIQDAESYQSIKALHDTTTITEICKRRLGDALTAIKANKILRDCGVYKQDKLDRKWIPEKEYEEKGWFVLKTQPTRYERKEVTNYRLTEKGATEITKLLKQHLMREDTQAA
ncbi:phage antirepressor KilAC domain-containing protein [Bacillus wiedmannii]|uniref:phage antirepressor KilAC domain-containing protein n=1 Tax=Bacillus wiedmannii TaxID=1890302 RepID=UPI001482FD13|nr:phage antirepressor KilAC domain-containing protein [Bacillus wiedmannii]